MFFYTAAEIFRCRGFSDSRERAHLVCRIWNIIRREERGSSCGLTTRVTPCVDLTPSKNIIY